MWGAKGESKIVKSFTMDLLLHFRSLSLFKQIIIELTIVLNERIKIENIHGKGFKFSID